MRERRNKGVPATSHAVEASHSLSEENDPNVHAPAGSSRRTGQSLKTSVVVSKDERLLADTLRALESSIGRMLHEVLVIDASNGALDDIRRTHPWAKWSDYHQPRSVRTTI
ncbi:MAG TPA: hypothetical protein VNE42_01100 [Acidimicrobiales bacterium]|nr:hypothetical protein [Acidimicrobiales bacterium]